MIQMLFSQIQQAPGPNFRVAGKSLEGKDEIAHMPMPVCAFAACTCDKYQNLMGSPIYIGPVKQTFWV